MRVFVAYVTHEDDKGSYVLVVRRQEEDAKLVCQAHFNQHIPNGDGHEIEWSPYRDAHAKGIQSINSEHNLTYYIESSELDFEADGKIDTRILDLEARLGQLAQSVKDQISMWKPLENRQIELEGFVDHLLGELKSRDPTLPDPYVFPNGEVWSKGEPT